MGVEPVITIRDTAGQGWDAFSDKPPAPSADSWDAFPDKPPSEGGLGMAKQGGIGVAKGAIGLAGMGGDLQQLAKKGGEALADRLPEMPETQVSKFLREETAHPRSGTIVDLSGKNTPGTIAYENRDKPSNFKAASGDLPGSYELPTSHDIQGAVEKVTGPFRKPQNQNEADAETVGEFLPAALAGPGGVVRKAITQVAMPAASTIVAGRYSDQNPYVKALAGFVGGLPGAVSGAGSAESLIRSKIPASVTEHDITRAGQLIDHAQTRGVQLTWPEALTRVTGQPILTDTQRILESHGQTRPAMQEFFAGRPGQVEQAARNEFDRVGSQSPTPSTLGPQASEASNSTLTDVRQRINQASEPFYQAAEGITLTPAEMSHVKAIPGWTEARDAVRNGPNAWRVKHLPDESVGFLNAVKKHFDQAAENAGSKFNPAKNQETRATHEAQASALRQIAIAISERHAGASPPPVPQGHIRYYHGTASPDASSFSGKTFVTPHYDYAKNYRSSGNNVLYTDMPKAEAVQRGLYDEINKFPINGAIDNGAAILKPYISGGGPNTYDAALRIQQIGREQYLNPIMQGPIGKLAKKDMTTQKAINVLFPENPVPGTEGEIRNAVFQLARQRPAVAEQLVRAHVEMVFNQAARDLQGGANQFAGAKFAVKLAGGTQQRANLQAAIEALPNGAARWEGFERLLDIMSATGARQPKGSLTAFNQLEVQSMSTGGVQELAAKGLSPGKWMSFANDAFKSWSLGRNLDQLARIITSPDSGQALRQIVRVPAGSDRALVMAGRIIAQAGAATTEQRAKQ